MKTRAVVVALLLVGAGVRAGAEAPGSSSGPSALALAGVVASHSPVLGSFNRRAMARLFRGKSISFPPNRKISVAADSIVCSASSVDVTLRTCELAFGAGKRSLTGREANEVFATLAAAGIASTVATGSVVENVAALNCTIDPNEIRQKAGGGAQCIFTTGR
jgi:hypothetical protein